MSPQPQPSDQTDGQELLESILAASTEYSIISGDGAGLLLSWNEGARRLYGFGAEEVVRRANLSVLQGDQAPPEALAKVLKGDVWNGTIEQRRKDQGRFPARVTFTPRRDKAGKVVGFVLVARDASDEVRSAEELRANEFYTRSLIESNIDALMSTDPLGIITDVNKQMEVLTGCSREELIGSRFKKYFTDPQRAEAGIRKVLREERVTNYELTASHKDGRQTVVSYNASTIRDSEGKLRGVFAAARDITEQKKLELQLRDSEAYNRGLIEASVDGLVTVDPQGNISDVNEQMSRMSGYPREELIGTPFADYFVDAELATAGVNETFQKGVVTNYVLTLATRRSHPVRVSFNASVFREAGKVRGIFASARDITEQSGLQTQLSQERAYNRGLIEASLDGLITVDPMITITDVNVTMCRMSGYTREELIGTPFANYFTEPKSASEGVRLTLDKGAVTNYQLTLRRKSEEEILVSFNAAIFKDDTTGAVRGIFASARDITEQARLQSQLGEERAYNRGLIEASIDGLVTVDQSMTITDVNDTLCTMVGRTRNHLIGSSFPDYFAEQRLAAQGVEQTFEKGLVTNYVLTLLAANGSKLPVSFNAAVFRDGSGKIRGIFASARDITAQKLLEGQLQASQVYTRSLIESNIDALMTTDPLGIITDVNQQMETLTGANREQLVGTPFRTYFTDPQRAEEGIRLVLRQGKVTNYELTARGMGGRDQVVSYNAVTFRDATGQLQGVFAAARDITDQKKLEEKLREQQIYLRGLIESSVDGLVTVDELGTITDINDRMCQMTGYGRAELIGTPFADYFTEPERARTGVQKTLNEGVVTEYALTLVARSRRLLQVSFNASVFKDPTGGVRGIFASARDITDRVRLEEQLREQQTYLRGLIESSLDGLVTVDPDGFITDVNEQMCRMAGYGRQELIGSMFAPYFTQPEKATQGVRRTFAEGAVANYDLVLTNKTGRKATVSFNASVFRGAEGRAQGIFASARDVSEQARLQTKLTEQQVYNRSLIEASADALFAIAPDGVITDVNEEATRLTGFSRKHLVNSRFAEYFTKPDEARSGVQQTLRDKRVIGYELVLITRYGRRIAVSFNAGVFSDAIGGALGILAAARDITAQKQLEQQLRDSQVYTRSLIESNIDALMTTDPLGLITDVNQQMEALTGATREELIGSPFKEHFTDPDRAEEGIREVLREGKVTNYELTARATSGVETVVSYNATTFNDQSGQLQGVFAAARDVTERRRFELALQEKNLELENAGLAKDRFLASVSHELRTPLALILGHTEKVIATGPAGTRTDLQVINRNARTLLKHVNDLLDIAKLEAGKTSLRYGNGDLARHTRYAASHFETVAADRGIRLEVDSERTSVPAQFDSEMMERVLLNLFSNAFKVVADKTGWIRASVRAEEDWVIITVEDNGPGIAPALRDAVFERFRQAELGTTQRYGGTGLGLAIAKEVVALHSGTIRVEESGHHGARFVVAIPGRAPAGTTLVELPAGATSDEMAAQAVAEFDVVPFAATGSAGKSSGTSPTVLVVEDNPEMSRFLVETLSANYHVISAGNGKEGLERAQAYAPDLVVTDLMMPIMSGDQMLQEMRKIPELAGIPALVVTARADDELRIKLLREVAQDYVVKPFAAEEVKARAQNLILAKRQREGLERMNDEVQTALNEAQVARDQAELATRVKSDFLNLVSHEMRTPLSALVLQLELLKRRGELNDPQRAVLTRIRGSATRASSLIESLLEYARLQQSQFPLRFATIDLHALAADVVEELHEQAQEKGIELSLSPTPATVEVTSDVDLMRLIISNLVGNAIKYTSEGRVAVSVATRDGNHLIEVTDTGPGIPVQQQSVMFDAFEQLEAVSSKHKKGFGLGLAITLQAAKVLGGSIEVDSKVGVGSRFTAVLPPVASQDQVAS